MSYMYFLRSCNHSVILCRITECIAAESVKCIFSTRPFAVTRTPASIASHLLFARSVFRLTGFHVFKS